MTKEIPILYNRKEECWDALRAMQFVLKRQFVWLKMKKDSNIHKLMMTNVFVVTNVLKFAL